MKQIIKTLTEEFADLSELIKGQKEEIKEKEKE
jgi:hypothetical protein